MPTAIIHLQSIMWRQCLAYNPTEKSEIIHVKGLAKLWAQGECSFNINFLVRATSPSVGTGTILIGWLF